MSLSTQELKEYLFHVRDLELSCYKQRKYVSKIENMLSEPQPKQISFKKEPEAEPPGLIGSFMSMFMLVIIHGIKISPLIFMSLGILERILFGTMAAIKQWLLITMAIPVGLGLVVAAFTFIPIYHYGLVEFQKTKQENIEKALQVEEKNRKNNEEFSLRKSIVKEEYSKATNALRTTEQTLAQFYNAGVVYQKYHGLIPITMFCEYIASGRCTELIGHEGAYNIYENDIRLNLIIVKLDEIISRLDQIQENQYMLADMMQKANRELENLTNIAAQQAQSLNRIESNTEIAGYYSAISAMNTTYLAWSKRH